MLEESLIEALQDISDIKCAVESIAYANNKIDWEQRRYEIAKSAMNGILSRNNNLPFNTHEKEVSEEVARISVALADALIAELKKTNETK